MERLQHDTATLGTAAGVNGKAMPHVCSCLSSGNIPLAKLTLVCVQWWPSLVVTGLLSWHTCSPALWTEL